MANINEFLSEAVNGPSAPEPGAPSSPSVDTGTKTLVVFALLAAAVFSLLIYIPAAMQFIQVLLLAVIALWVSRH